MGLKTIILIIIGCREISVLEIEKRYVTKKKNEKYHFSHPRFKLDIYALITR